MKPLRLVVCAACAALCPAQKPPTQPAAAGTYYRLKQIQVIDQQGFGQPVEVVRLLVPSDWRDQSGVTWDNQQLRCPANIIQIRLQAASADGLSAIEYAPGYLWQAATDPMMQQILRQQAAARTGCDTGPVTSAVDYLRQAVIPRMRPGARIVKAEPMAAMTQAKQSQLAQSYQPMVQAGYVRSYRADSASVRIEYTRSGQAVEEWVMATLVTVATPSANTAALMQGQMNMSALTYSVMSEGVLSVRAPAGRFDNKLAATMMASTRPNPQYQAAVSQFLANMGNIAARGAMDRARIWREAGQQISATISQAYQQQQAVQDRAAAQFSQAIRGVETYVNPVSGKQVELAGGYENAWISPRGEYLLSDSPGFDPGVALRENWTKLAKPR
ncbi:MAG: hypothetical protein HY820_17190 [Acidobacteria bacterium]|nr:hypothetical protein [Acidobacteriota bacterium]